MALSYDYLEELQKKRKKALGDPLEIDTSSTSGGVSYEYLENIQNAREENMKDIAPVRQPVFEDDEGFFKMGVFQDGYDFGDVTKSILGTTADLGLNAVAGIGNLAEGVGDAINYGISDVADFFGADDFAYNLREETKKNLVDQLLGGTIDKVDKYSVAGKTMDSVAQGVGMMGAIIGTGGALGGLGLSSGAVTGATTGLMGLSGLGSGMSEAYEGGATDKEARIYGVISGTADALSELLFGGLGKGVKALGFSKGLSSADDILAKKVSSMFSNQIMKNLSEFGIKASAEGLEEVIAGLGQGIGKKITYMSEEDISKILKDEKLLEQFVVSSVTSGLMQTGGLVKANKTKSDFITGLNENEQKVVDKEVENRVAEQEQDGNKLSKKDKDKIYDEVLTALDEGAISIDTIESAIGGETYDNYKSTVDQEEALKTEYDTLNKMKKMDMTGEQEDRRAELKQQLEDLKTNSQRDALRKQLGDEVYNIAKDSRLVESYNERARKGQSYEADLTKYDEKQKAIVQKAIDSGVLNNTRKAHKLVDLIAKISADKGVSFDFVNNEKLKETGFALEGKTADGFVDNDGNVVINVDSPKYLNSVVGHEITHILEGTELYTELEAVVKQFATTKGEYANRMQSLRDMYTGVYEGKDFDEKIRRELTSDIVGEYLFTDDKFINNLSTEKPNLFKKIYDEIKYLCKVATAGSKESRELEKVKRAFEKAYKESVNTKADADTKYSLSSISNTFFGDPDMTTDEFTKADYKETQGYKNYVEQCVNNLRQTRADFDEGVARKEIEDSIDGIVRVAIASKKAGYDIYDDNQKRDLKDSKERLLFSSLEPNSEYTTSNDISTICDKSKNFQAIYDEIVRKEEALGVPVGKRFFDKVDNYFYLHRVLAQKGLTQPCRQCYVDSMRKNLTPMANAFLKLVTETNPNNKANDQLYNKSGKSKGSLKINNAKLRERVLELLAEDNMSANELTHEMLTTEDGLATLRLQHPMIYEAFNSFYGQSKPKMPKSPTPFRFGELTALLTNEKGEIKKSLVKQINSTGGFRLQSYSDFQIANYVDTLQVLFEAGTLGLSGHAYTKVPAFLDATEGTNLKRNISIFMYKDGDEWKIDKNDSFPYELEEIYDIVNNDESGNTSIIAVSQNADMSAWIMANDYVGYGIPFHKSGHKMGTVRDTDVVTDDGRTVKGYKNAIDHTKQQTEVWAKTTADHKINTKVTKPINIYEFWDFNNTENLSKNELIEKNVKAYIDACNEAGYLPKFRDYVMNNDKVISNVLKYSKQLGFMPQDATIDDISFEYSGYRIPYGYYKFLGDFGMFTPDGKASPHNTLSLENYDFDKAEEFFSDAKTLRRNEILQQFSNGMQREFYRNSNLTAEQLEEKIKQMRTEVADSIVAPVKETKTRYSLSEADDTRNQKQNINMEDLSSRELFDNIGRISINIRSIERDLKKAAFNYPSSDMVENYNRRLIDAKSEYLDYGEYILENRESFSDNEILQLGIALKLYHWTDKEKHTREDALKLLEEKVESYNNDWYNSLSYEDKKLYKAMQIMSNQEDGSSDGTEFETGTFDDFGDFLLDDFDFSLSNENDIAPIRQGNLHISGDDVRLVEAPMGVVENATTTKVVGDAKPTKKAKLDKGKMQEEKIAKVMVTEPKKAKKHNLKRDWERFANNFLDRATPVETLALETGNRELDGKFNTIRYADTKAQTLIGKGAKDKGVKPIKEIFEQVGDEADLEKFYDYLYHKHNIDRMSFEDKEAPHLAELTEEMRKLKLDALEENQLFVISKESITKDTTKKRADLINTVREYLKSKGIKNKPVFADSVTAEVSQGYVDKYEFENPEFVKFAKDVYNYNRHLRDLLVEGGVISQKTADYFEKLYPHYVPIGRVGRNGTNINVPLDSRRTGVNTPIKRAEGGNSDIRPLHTIMAERTLQTYKAVAKNRFGVELKNTLGTTIDITVADVDEVIEGVDTHEELLKEGKYGANPTFTVFENGKKVTFEITEALYDSLKPTSEAMSRTYSALSTPTGWFKKLVTEYNPSFALTNPIKDTQDVLLNSQHPLKTYKNFPKAIKELASKSGQYYNEYIENGGEDDTYFDKESSSFVEEKSGIKKIVGFPFEKISEVNNFIERIPRLAEYIASREMGRSIDVSMLDSARVTTNFRAGGDITKFLNRNGATFLNPSVQGAIQQVRNVREAKANGLKGWGLLATKIMVAGLPAMLLNGLLWDDDEDYEELSDYVKKNYYVVWKNDDGKFIRIPKGRASAVIQDAFKQMQNLATGDDEVDLEGFLDLVVSNLAPNNPIDNNIISPIMQIKNNKTWYGEDLVPTRLQDLPAKEQYDESTDKFSKWLGDKLDISPVKVNYFINQYSGGAGDMILPMLTPEAESGNDSKLGNLFAPVRDKFTTDSVLNNQNVSDFYEIGDELKVNANSIEATDEDILKNKYFNAMRTEISDLYKQKRELQNDEYLSDSEKYNRVREIQKQINTLSKEALNSYGSVNITGRYAEIGDKQYRLNNDNEWQKISNDEIEKQNQVIDILGISKSEYWNNKKEYDMKALNPEKYKVLQEQGISVEDYKENYEEGFFKYTDDYSWASDNIGKYTLSKAITDDVSMYKQYTSDLDDIRADENANGKKISGSAKRKKMDYISNLDIDYGAKCILFRSQYKKDNTYNYDIINYLNERNDITYDEKVTILQELGISVDADGNISW